MIRSQRSILFHFYLEYSFSIILRLYQIEKFYFRFYFYLIYFLIGLLKPKSKRPKMDADGVLIPAPLAPHRDPTPLEVLSRFTIAQDEELPGLVWDLIDEVIKYLKT